jgi:hypothetical protein
VKRWNRIAIDASGLDHTPVSINETCVLGEQLGPALASRAMAIVHISMFDAMNAIVGFPFPDGKTHCALNCGTHLRCH